MNVLLQICDLPDTTPSSKLAYWQSQALSRELSARAGSQSQLNTQQLVSCPSLLATALTSDPAVVMVPLQSPPKRSEVADWLQQLDCGAPVDSRPTSENSAVSQKDAEPVAGASRSLPDNCGQSVESKHISVPSMNMESVNITLTGMAEQQIEASRTENAGFDAEQQKSDHNSSSSNSIIIAGAGDDDVRMRKKSLLLRRKGRVSFLADMEQTESNAAGLLGDDGPNFDDEAADKSHSAAAASTSCDIDDDDDDDDDFQKMEDQKSSSVSNSASILFGTQPSSSGQSLPKASFIDLEVPASWQSRHHLHMSGGSQHSGSVDLPPCSSTLPEALRGSQHPSSVEVRPCSTIIPGGSQHFDSAKMQPFSVTVPEASTARASVHVASTPTASRKGRRDGEDVNLSAISCSPITPRTISAESLRTLSRERTNSPGVETQNEEEEDDDVTVIPCSPIIPSTPAQSDQCVKTRTHGMETGTDGAARHHSDDEDGDILVIPCTPVTPTSSQTVDNSSCGKRLSAGVEDQQGGKPEDEVTIVPCSPVTPTAIPLPAVKNKPRTGDQRFPHFKVIFCFVWYPETIQCSCVSQ